jgi:predicted HTH domain antitoxin
MTEDLRVKRSELGPDTERILRAVQAGEIVVIEQDGRSEAAIMDIIDFRLLRAFATYHDRRVEQDLTPEPTDERFAGLDEQGRYDLVMAYYQSQNISIGRAAELLRIPMIDYQLRCARLGIPLYLGPATLEELREEIAGAERVAARVRHAREQSA